MNHIDVIRIFRLPSAMVLTSSNGEYVASTTSQCTPELQLTNPRSESYLGRKLLVCIWLYVDIRLGRGKNVTQAKVATQCRQ